MHGWRAAGVYGRRTSWVCRLSTVHLKPYRDQALHTAAATSTRMTLCVTNSVGRIQTVLLESSDS
jgi:hypothetical protein